MKEIKFKIVELTTHQVLFTKDFNDESDPIIVVSIFFDGVKTDLKLCYYNYGKRDEMFDSFDFGKTQKLINMIKSRI